MKGESMKGELKNAIFLAFAVICMTVSGCGKAKTINFDLMLEDLNSRYYFDIPGDDGFSLNLLDKDKKESALRGNGFLVYDVFEKDDCIIAKTMTNQKMETYLTKTFRSNGQTEYIKLRDAGYKMGMGESLIYQMYCYPVGIQIEVYDLDLNPIHTYEVQIDEMMLMPQGIGEYGGYIWLLCGAVDQNDWSTGTKTLLLKLNQDFTVLETIDLGISKGSVRDMEIVNNLMYFTVTTDGLNGDGTAAGGRTVGMFNLDTYENQPDMYYLDNEYPFSIDYVPQLNQLVITHDHTQTGLFLRSFVDLNDGSVHSVQFPAELGDDDRDALFSIYNNKYLFLFRTSLVIVDAASYEFNVLDLSEYGFTGAGSIIVNPLNES